MRIYLAALLVTFALSGCATQPLEPERLTTRVIIDTAIDSIGSINKIVQLETNDESLIGSIRRVRVHAETGDIFVGDFDSTDTLYRFDSEGKFLEQYPVDSAPYKTWDFVLTDDALFLLDSLNIQRISLSDRHISASLSYNRIWCLGRLKKSGVSG